VRMIERAVRTAIAVLGLAAAVGASAQLPASPVPPALQSGTNNYFQIQNPLGPKGSAYQVNYPYPGQCLADRTNNGILFPQLADCGAASSFACAIGTTSNRTAGGWASCGGRIPFAALTPIVPASVPVAPAVATPKFVFEVLNPMDYTPDTTTYPGAHYYELGLHEAWGFQTLATAGAFPDPTVAPYSGLAVPNGMQWTGLRCNIPGGCSCPADIKAGVYAACTGLPGQKIPNGAPLYTPIWGVGQKNIFFLGGLPATPSPWSQNNYFATWPSISIRANKNTPVVVKWVNEFPNNHVLCPHPDAADWPCAIDRTFMGVKSRVDPGLAHSAFVPPEGVNAYGSPQQPDNSWVTHLHGGEIPPSTDGFAEKWFGNQVTAPLYANAFMNPPFEAPEGTPPALNPLKRPTGFSDVYTYPMVQEEATIWFHDHTLGKTHHNVIAGPAGFFPVRDPDKHAALVGWAYPTAGAAALPATQSYTWLDPITVPRDGLGRPLYDLFLAIQDRAFNDDGSINFSNGLGQTIPPPPAVLPIGYSPVTNGVNPQVHPTWVPEYFGDHALVNGVLWPKATVAAGWYRIRVVDGSDSRCYTSGFRVQKPNTAAPAAGKNVGENLPFWIIANDQGYLKNPVLVATTFTMCPGERYELLVNFGQLGNGIVNGAAADVYMTNNAPAPFPAGFKPFGAGSPYPEMNMIMKFVVDPRASPLGKGPGVKSCVPPATFSYDPANPPNPPEAACMPPNPALITDPNYRDIRPTQPFPAGTIVRQVYLNEKVDNVTLAPLGMQLNGVPFEYKVTETPLAGTREVWQFVNLTVDAHPMHPHLVQHQIVSRQAFNVNGYKTALCGASKCMPGPAPGNEMQVVPDVGPFLTGALAPVTTASVESGFKDVSQAPPGQVTTVVADWAPRWTPTTLTATSVRVPGMASCPPNGSCGKASFVYEDVTAGPYVWHCHINSHEDSEMMRSSLVVR
jgi:spore coat protein A